MGLEKLTKDPKFENMAVRSQNTEELVQILNKVFATKTRDEWVEHFSKQGDLIYAPVQTISEVVDDPQALANEYVIEFNHPVWGPTRETGFPWKFSKTPASARTAAPAFGQHTEEIMLELGYSWNDISQLKQEEVI
jgi:crotonobetainyl-CoA:carnitine CoA-transferase CaiB-like acyl-CoA transferase